MSTGSVVGRPIPGSPRPYQFPDFESIKLPNGIEVIVAPVRRLPLVTIRIVIEAGARSETPPEAGLASLTALALAEGTTRLDSASLATEFENLGGSLSSDATWDSAQAATTVTAERFEAALGLLGEVVQSPALPAREIERLREERLAELLELKTEPRGLADERFAGLLYRATSRFSLPEAGSEQTVQARTPAQCRGWHATQFVPPATTVVVCGDVATEHAASTVYSVLGSWQGSSPPAPLADDGPANVEPVLRLIHRPGAPQTEIRVGHVGLPRNHPDYFDVVVMNAILGGVFNSRINLNLRERNAFTYGAFSSFEWRRDAGAFMVSTAVATNVTAAAVREILAELERMRSSPPTEDELSLCTSYLDGVFPLRFETTDAIAVALSSLRIHRLPSDYFDTYRERIRAVTADGVARAARAHLHSARLQILAVGDRDQIEPELKALDLGPVIETEA